MPRGRLPETLRLSRSRLLMSGSALLWGLQFAFLTPSIGIILVALYSATPGEVGWALMLYNISGFISTLVVPSRADRQGDYLRPLLWCGGLTIALATALALVMSLPMAFLALVALGGPAGVGIGLLFAHQKHVGTSVSGIMKTRAIFSFAWVAGPPIATFMIGLLGKRSVLWAVVAIAALGLAFTILMMRERARTGGPIVTEDSRESVLTVLREPRVVVMTLAFLVLVGTTSASVATVALFATNRLDLDVIWGGVALGTCAALEIPILLGLGRLTTRFGPARLLLVGSIAGVIYYASMVVIDGPVLLVALQVLNAIFIATVQGLGLTIFQEVVPRPGLASGLFMNTQRLGAILSGPIIALGALPGLGYAWVFAACVPLVLLGLGLLAVARRLGR
ncbi:Major Facilitator Superfamily transporter [Phycicoccus elongatus Lp2]|uniref:Major Facilitator Superfamily transporter n=1 Tax=Phycicoccus elongatus Lp2 TaxID=1193181 RepID=N0E4L2_9MICO|nr:MFS transporter [Phycicoccus elongatus]CCH70831.1 Major Facilitator Superfamily transporter [Phycicoccus elongatus Lp2]